MSKHDRQRGDTFITPRGHVCFPHVFKPRSMEGQEPKFSLILVFEKKEDIEIFRRFENELKRKAWKVKPSNYRSPIRENSEMVVEDEDGRVTRKRGFENDGWFIRFSCGKAPEILGPKKETITDSTPNGFYPGCFARVACNAYTYDQKGNRGVSFGLQNIQKTGDGEPIAGWVSAAKQFDEIEVDDEGWDAKKDDDANEDGEDW